MQPPYQGIAAEIAARIATGELAPGDRVPSIRDIIERYGVSMATATKALTELRLQGLIRAAPGVGTVVAGPTDRRRGRAGPPPGDARRAAAADDTIDVEELME